MLRTIRRSRSVVWVATLAGALLVLPQVGVAKAWGSPGLSDDNKPNQELKKKLDGKQFQNVQVNVDDNGVATLTGTVDLYEYKADADRKAHKVKGVKAVNNEIQVGGDGKNISDQELQQKIQQKLQYDRVGYGTNAFNAITVSVQNGEVTLGGHAYGYPDKNSALGVVSMMPGVKDVTDEIQVDPPSPMDDQIRLRVARAVYGFPSLNRYAIDPANPIRISVHGGHVELYGVVDSKADKDTAYIQANQVPGVFGVENHLQVAGQQGDQEKEQQKQK